MINQPDDALPMNEPSCAGVGVYAISQRGRTGNPGARLEVSEVSDLADVVRQLAEHHLKSPALIVQTSEGEYVVSPDGMGGSTRNRS